MRLKKYLNEKVEFDEIWNDISSNCSDFLNEVYDNDNISFLWRGTNKNIPDISKIIPRNNRKPKDSPQKMHDIFDQIFKKKFGWKARSEGVFVSNDRDMAENYDNPYIFFPANGYKYIWSPEIDDLYSSDEILSEMPLASKKINVYNYIDKYNFSFEKLYFFNIYSIDTINKILKEKYDFFKNKYIKNFEEYEQEFFKWIEWERERKSKEIVNTYKDKGLKKLLKLSPYYTGREVMFKCKYYYLINPIYEFNIINEI